MDLNKLAIFNIFSLVLGMCAYMHSKLSHYFYSFITQNVSQCSAKM